MSHAEVRRFMEDAEGTQEVLALLRHTQAQGVNSVPSVFMDGRLVHGGIDAVQELIINGERK